MKWFSFIILGLILIIAIWFFLDRQRDSGILIGGERDEQGCLIAAGYSFNKNVGACVRQFEMTPDIEDAARKAVEYAGGGYALTVISFNSYEETGSYDIVLERGEERETEIIYIRNNEVIPPPSHDDAEMTALKFMQDVVAIAPPNIDKEAAKRIYKALSSAARAEVSEETLSRDIASFVKIQDVPDQGISIEDLQIVSVREVYLIIGLNYSGSRALRNIHLVIEDGIWKVDKVSISNEAGRFEAKGNLVRNNPGMEKNVWYLIYEVVGAPALTKKLRFTSASICAHGVENNICNPDSFNQGQQVNVIGEQAPEDTINVLRIELR
jgi:hypothetical protein